MNYPPPQQPFYYGAPPPRQSSGLSAGGILVLFIVILLILTVVGAIYVLLSQPLPPLAPCEPGQVCAPRPSLPPVAGRSPSPTRSGFSPAPSAAPSPAGTPPQPTPPSQSQVMVVGEVWRSATLGYSFEYDPGTFQVSQSSDDFAMFDVSFADAQVVVVGASGDLSPGQLIQRELSTEIDSFVVGRTLDKDPYDQLLGPSIGYIRGEGAVYAGTITGSDGTPIAPGGITIVASTDGRITVAVIVLVAEPDVLDGPDTVQYHVRKETDEFLKTFNWGPT